MTEFNQLSMKILSEKYFAPGESTPEELFTRVASSNALVDVIYDCAESGSDRDSCTLSTKVLRVLSIDDTIKQLKDYGYGLYETFTILLRNGLNVVESKKISAKLADGLLNSDFFDKMNTYKNAMLNMEFMPATPTLINTGRSIGMLSSCFYIEVEDSMDDIFSKVKDVALISKAGGGVGIGVSKLRPEGAPVKDTNGTSSGPISFLKVFNETGNQVQQGGIRRAALIATLSVYHPDIMKFIMCKAEEGVLQNFNLSVLVDDNFMKMVSIDGEITLTHPTVSPTQIKAREVWEKLTEMAHKNGEPGIIFMDRIRKDDVFSGKFGDLGVNPCVTDDTWVMTKLGPKQVKDLIGKNFIAIVNGKEFNAKGFFKTGKKKIVEITTHEGLKIRSTKNHKFLRLKKNKVRSKYFQKKWIKASDLMCGDKVAIHTHENEIYYNNYEYLAWNGEGTFSEGYLLGALLGDGHFVTDKVACIEVWDNADENSLLSPMLDYVKPLKKRSDFRGFTYVPNHKKYHLALGSLCKLANKFDITRKNKHITALIEKTSSNFHKGFLRGLFDADGSVQGTQKKGVSIRLAQSNLSDLEAVQRMLLRFGIQSKIYFRRPAQERSLPDAHRNPKVYKVKAQYELIISRKSLQKYAEVISFNHTGKRKKLDNKLNSYVKSLDADKNYVTILGIRDAGEEKVYDTTVPGIHAFDANGFYVHNCGEITLLPYESCNLGAINLSTLYDPKYPMLVNTDRLKELVRLGINFLDNIIDINNYPLKQLRTTTEKTRRLGLGTFGLHDLMLKMGITYGSDDSLSFISYIYGIIQETSNEESIKLGESRGVPNDLTTSTVPTRRNAGLLAAQPTGTVAMICNQASSGIEPVFQFEYGRKDSYGKHEIKHFILDKFKDNLPQYAVTSLDIPPEDHVKVQSRLQEYIDNAISKTVNLPHNATIEDVRNTYTQAWKSGCKSITVYRSGSRKEEVLSEKATRTVDSITPSDKKRLRDRPRVLFGATTRIQTPGGKAYITVNEDNEGVREVFIHISKAGSETNTHVELEGRLISNALKHRVPAEELINHAKGHKSNPVLDCGKSVKSVPDAVSTVLQEYLDNYEGFSLYIEEDVAKTALSLPEVIDMHEISGELCPECGEVLYMAGGCTECISCGYSRCG